MKSFETYLEEKKIKLTRWQRVAADDFLVNMRPNQGDASFGKSFLLKVLTNFINEHGNNFCVTKMERLTIEGLIKNKPRPLS
jgi:hypothetical protein